MPAMIKIDRFDMALHTPSPTRWMPYSLDLRDRALVTNNPFILPGVNPL
jgi:hypothetical protein